MLTYEEFRRRLAALEADLLALRRPPHRRAAAGLTIETGVTATPSAI